MANVNAPFGLRPVRTMSGSPFNSQGRLVYIPSANTDAMYIGDAVISDGSGDADGVPGISKYTGTGTMRGVIVGFKTNPADQYAISVPATKTKAYYAYIIEDPNTVFEIQDDGAAALTAANIGQNADMTIAAPTGIGNQSASTLSAASAATTSTLAVRILGLAPKTSTPGGNAFGTYAVWEVKINNSEFATGVTGV